MSTGQWCILFNFRESAQKSSKMIIHVAAAIVHICNFSLLRRLAVLCIVLHGMKKVSVCFKTNVKMKLLWDIHVRVQQIYRYFNAHLINRWSFVDLRSIFKLINCYKIFTFFYVYFKHSTYLRVLKGYFLPWERFVHGTCKTCYSTYKCYQMCLLIVILY